MVFTTFHSHAGADQGRRERDAGRRQEAYHLADPSGCARCGAGTGCSEIKYQSLSSVSAFALTRVPRGGPWVCGDGNNDDEDDLVYRGHSKVRTNTDPWSYGRGIGPPLVPLYRGTSLIRNCPPLGSTVGPWAVSYERGTPAMPQDSAYCRVLGGRRVRMGGAPMYVGTERAACSLCEYRGTSLIRNCHPQRTTAKP